MRWGARGATSEPEELTLLGPRLQVLMLSLSALIFTVIAWLVPSLYERSQLNERQAEAEVAARSLSASLGRLVGTYPESWIYHYRLVQRELLVITEMGSFVQVSNHLGARYLIGREGLRRLSPGEVPLKREGVTGVAQLKMGDRHAGELTLYLTVTQSEPLRGVWLSAALLGALTSLLISVIPLWLSRRGDQQNRALLSALRELNLTLEDKITRRTHELDLLNTRLLSVQEEERARISRDLHDELGQTLTGARLQLTTSALLTPGSREAIDLFEEGLRELDYGVEQVRSIAYALRPPELDELGLIAALERHVTRRARSAGLELSLHIELPQLSRELSTSVFRVVQEGLTNVIRHARASRVEVSLSALNERDLKLMIQDNGVGLSSPVNEGVGLIGIRSRAREHGGEVTLLNTALGTSLQVTFPRRPLGEGSSTEEL